MKNLLSIVCLCLLGIHAFAQNAETRNVGSFDAVHVSSSFDVILEKGRSESVRLEISGMDLNEIKTEVSSGTLKIYRKSKRKNWNSKARGKIYVTYEELSEVHSSGSSDVYCSDPLSARRFEATTSGSGNMTLSDLDAQDLSVRISGSSDLEIAGDVESQEISISGSGNYDAEELDCDEVSIRISGSGDARIVAKESLDARVSGSGDIAYWGSPRYVDTHTSGSGSIHKKGNYD